MKTNRIQRCALGVGMALAAAALAAEDTVLTRSGGMVGGRIVRLTASEVVFTNDQAVAWTDVAGVSFDRAALRAPGQRIVLRNGTALCGVVRRATSGGVVFRSVTAGEIETAWANVSSIRFEAEADLRVSASGAAGEIVLVRMDGSQHKGRLMAATSRRLLLRTADGLEKYDAWDVAWLAAGPPPAPAAGGAVVLRNGDRLCGPVTWRDDRCSIETNGQTVEVKLAAIRAIEFPASAQKGKE